MIFDAPCFFRQNLAWCGGFPFADFLALHLKALRHSECILTLGWIASASMATSSTMFSHSSFPLVCASWVIASVSCHLKRFGVKAAAVRWG